MYFLVGAFGTKVPTKSTSGSTGGPSVKWAREPRSFCLSKVIPDSGKWKWKWERDLKLRNDENDHFLKSVLFWKSFKTLEIHVLFRFKNRGNSSLLWTEYRKCLFLNPCTFWKSFKIRIKYFYDWNENELQNDKVKYNYIMK